MFSDMFKTSTFFNVLSWVERWMYTIYCYDRLMDFDQWVDHWAEIDKYSEKADFTSWWRRQDYSGDY